MLQALIQLAMNHPVILSILGVSTFIGSLPHLLHVLEVKAIKNFLANRDPIDQKALKGTVSVWVTWAEEKYGAGKGPVKFEAVDMILAKVIPFMNADDRKKLIEELVKELDSGAHEATQ